ncbi:MAG: ATP-dependent DNA ligase [Candidatus Eisenbacteria bacterium]|nr:ATP-dependent DNA ligase [Candidatus Eisenbacteria bacterium]
MRAAKRTARTPVKIDLHEELPAAERELLRQRRQPRWTSPMLAVLTDKRFADAEWSYERKLDGVRCLVFRRGKQVRLVSRNRKSMNRTYPELVEEIGRQPIDHFIADGEIVAFAGNRTSFQRLQQRIGIRDPQEARRRGVAVYLYLFDLLHLGDYDTTRLPQHRRKALLRKALRYSNRLRYTPHRRHTGLDYYRESCRKGREGVIVKRRDAPYRHGRSTDWLKFKCVNQQEFVIGGYTEPEGQRIGFGALHVGFYADGKLRYAGKVGTGYDRQTLRDLSRRLGRIERHSSPFADGDEIAAGQTHWVSPKLVAEIGFTEWTAEHRLRHPRFLGLREDKAPRKVRRETPGG